MRKFTSFLFVLFVAMVVKAQTTETYDFYSFATGDGYMTTVGDPISIDAEEAAVTQYFTAVYKVANLTIGSTTMDFKDRFAFNTVSTSYQMYWRFRNTGTTYQKGLICQWNNGKTANSTANISILGLYNGDKVTVNYAIKSDAAKLSFVKSGIATLDGSAVASGDAMASGKTYTIVAADDNSTVNLDLYITNNNIGIHSVTIVSDKVAETVEAPELAVTGAYNGNRTITITPVTEGTAGSPVKGTYYTIDGSEPDDTNGEAYSVPFVISETSTIKAITYLENGVASDVVSLEVAAGETISLNGNIVDVTNLTGGGEVMNAVVTNVYTSAGLIGTPTATFTYTFNGETVELPYTVIEDGTLVATATADGYASTSETLELKAGYVATKNIDFASVSQDDFFAAYEGDWSAVGEYRLSNWSKSYTYSGTQLKGSYIFDSFFSCSGNSSYPLTQNFGVGIGRSTGTAYQVVNASEGELALFEVNKSLKPTTDLVQVVISDISSGKLVYNAGASEVIAKVSLYTPVRELVVTDGENFAPEYDYYTSATYTRSIAAGAYGTICLPFAPDEASRAAYNFYELTDASTVDGTVDEVTFTKVDAPEANKPYIYRLADGAVVGTAITCGATEVSKEAGTTIITDWQMVGSFEAYTVDCTDKAIYALLNYGETQKLMKVTQSLYVPAYRAYIQGVGGSESGTRQSFTVRISGPTGIEQISAADVEGLLPATIYDLMGRPVQNPQKGHLYIQGGKKVVY